MFAGIRDQSRSFIHTRLTSHHRITSADFEMNSNGSGDKGYRVGHADFEVTYGYKNGETENPRLKSEFSLRKRIICREVNLGVGPVVQQKKCERVSHMSPLKRLLRADALCLGLRPGWVIAAWLGLWSGHLWWNGGWLDIRETNTMQPWRPVQRLISHLLWKNCWWEEESHIGWAGGKNSWGMMNKTL